jgi:hypothetical protein
MRIETGGICKFSATRAKTDGKKWRAFANSDDSQGRMIFAQMQSCQPGFSITGASPQIPATRRPASAPPLPPSAAWLWIEPL